MISFTAIDAKVDFNEYEIVNENIIEFDINLK
jgi:hypothetical protein